jgi:hypothetical protein
MADEEEMKQKLQREMVRNHDILLVPCKDVDSGMPVEDSSTTCKVLQGIQYVHESYAFNFLARIGDDAYFRLDYFWNVVRHGLPAGPTYIGRILMNEKVWEPHLQDHLGLQLYPPYASGMGYIFSFGVAAYIATASRLVKFRTGYPEDAVVGLWLAGIQLTRFHTLEFHNAPGAQYGSKECSTSSILIHYMTEDLWNAIDDEGICHCT